MPALIRQKSRINIKAIQANNVKHRIVTPMETIGANIYHCRPSSLLLIGSVERVVILNKQPPDSVIAAL